MVVVIVVAVMILKVLVNGVGHLRMFLVTLVRTMKTVSNSVNLQVHHLELMDFTMDLTLVLLNIMAMLLLFMMVKLNSLAINMVSGSFGSYLMMDITKFTKKPLAVRAILRSKKDKVLKLATLLVS